MKVLVTGATGFLGMAICKQLFQNGYSLRCQYRTNPKLLALQAYLKNTNSTAGNTDVDKVDNDGLSIDSGADSEQTSFKSTSNTMSGNDSPTVEYVQQDLVGASQSDIKSMVQGCSMVVHNAAAVKDYGSSQVAYATNVNSTECLLIAAINCQIDRFVYISSIVVHGLKSAENITEEGPYNRLYNIYAKTKQRAEQAVQLVAQQHNYRNYVIIRPGSIYGTGDHTTYYKIFEAIGNRQLPYAGTKRGIVPLIHKDDVADAIRCALHPNPAICEQAFNIVSDERVEFKELFDFIANRLSVKPPSLVVPRLVAYMVSIVVMLIRKIPLVNVEPITLFRIRSMMSRRTFDTTKLKEVLRFTPSRDWKSGFVESIDQYLRDKPSS